MKIRIGNLSKEPLVYFFVLGFVVFALHSFLNRAEQDDSDPFTVNVASTDIEWIKASFEARMKRGPTQKELQILIDQYIRDEILHREALAMDLDDRDLVIQRRLVQKLTFVFEDLAETVEPTDDELLAYLEENQEKYRISETLSFHQVYFSPEKRKTAVEDANAIVAKLKLREIPPEEAVMLGDTTLIDTSFRNKSPTEVARVLGQSFTDTLFALGEPGWQGPIASTFGWHLVYIDDRIPAKMPALETIRGDVKYDFMYARKKEVIDAAYNAARSRYAVYVEGLPHE